MQQAPPVVDVEPEGPPAFIPFGDDERRAREPERRQKGDNEERRVPPQEQDLTATGTPTPDASHLSGVSGDGLAPDAGSEIGDGGTPEHGGMDVDVVQGVRGKGPFKSTHSEAKF